MAWVKIDDQFTDHPKIVAAGPLAGWLYVAGLCYSARYLTDGFVPRAQVRKLVDVDEVTPLVTALVTAGLWRESQGGYTIHDYLDYNPPAEKVKAERAANAQRQAKYKETLRNAGEPSIYNTVSNTVTNGVTTAVPSPSPSPSPSTSSLRSEVEMGAPQADAPRTAPAPKHSTTQRASRIPEDFEVTAEMLEWAASEVPGLDVRWHTEEFRDYWRGVPGQRGVKLDWVGTWRNAMRKAYERIPQGNGQPRAAPKLTPAQQREAQILAESEERRRRRVVPNTIECPGPS